MNVLLFDNDVIYFAGYTTLISDFELFEGYKPHQINIKKLNINKLSFLLGHFFNPSWRAAY